MVAVLFSLEGLHFGFREALFLCLLGPLDKSFRILSLLVVIASLLTTSSARAHEGWGIVVNASGEIYVGDIPADVIWKISKEGKVEKVAERKHSHALVLDSAGNLYGTNPHFTLPIRTVWRLTPDGQLSDLIPPAENFPLGLQSFIMDGLGNMYSLSAANPKTRETLLLKRSPEGEITSLAGSTKGHADGTGSQAKFMGIDGMAWGPDGHLYITDGPYVRRVTRDGVVTTIGGPLTEPEWEEDLSGIAVNTNGDIYVADYASRRILKITPAGAVSTFLRTGSLWTPTGVTVAPDGVYVLEHLRMPFGILGELEVGPYLRVSKVSLANEVTELARIWGRWTAAAAVGVAAIVGLIFLIAMRRKPKQSERPAQAKATLRFPFLILVALLCFGRVLTTRADGVDEFITAQMKKRGITGLSLAIIDGGSIVKEQGYGFTDKSGKTPVTASTLFQAGSISKPVAALGALHLVDKGLLSLDEDVNTKLRTWSVPQNKFTDAHKVTLRLILSHSAGLTVYGFPGYARGRPIPTLTQMLNGEKPANTDAIRVNQIPGSQWKYSGGGYLVMQQMLIDVTRKPFAQLMDEAVLKPLRMTSSTYAQPLPNDLALRAAKGYGGIFGYSVNGAWYVYPEMAAAGLWTTAGDLARFAIGIQNAISGQSDPVISQSMAQQMLTSQKNNVGLGLFLESSGKTLRFRHEGRTAGFDAVMKAYAYLGKGAVVMTNKNDDGDPLKQIFGAIAEQYDWPDYQIPKKK